MDLERLEAINAETLCQLRAAPSGIQPADHPYFGFYAVDLFECPPFLMFTANDCPRATNILYGRRFEPMSMRVWCRLVPRATGIFDVGAHVGVYSLAAAALRSDVPIHAFEPNVHAIARLRVHKIVNEFANIQEHRIALANFDGTTTLSWVHRPDLRISSGGTILQISDPGYHKDIVEARRFDSLSVAKEIGTRGLIKIDVEGAEASLIKGMPETLQRRPDIILECLFESNAERIMKRLPKEYRVYRVHEKAMQLELVEQLTAALVESGDPNFFLTARPESEIHSLTRDA